MAYFSLVLGIVTLCNGLYLMSNKGNKLSKDNDLNYKVLLLNTIIASVFFVSGAVLIASATLAFH